MINTLRKPDSFGAFASSLCLVHCVATPFIFVAQTCSATCCTSEAVPTWWVWIDYFFLVVAFFAVYQSTKTTSKNWIKPAMWASWLALFFIILNEKFMWVTLFEQAIYIPALALVGLHIYNLKYCQCESDVCINNNNLELNRTT